MKIQEVAAVAVVTAVVVAAITYLVIAPGDGVWKKYIGFNGENGAADVGENVGKYIDAIYGRAHGDGSLKDSFRKQIKDRCDALRTKRFKDHTNDETYLVLVVAERHSALHHWKQVWERLGGTLQTDGTNKWKEEYKPDSNKVNLYKLRTVESLLEQISGRYGSHNKIPGRCAERIEIPYKTANRNTGWARILLAYEYGKLKPDLVAQELDHPEGKTK